MTNETNGSPAVGDPKLREAVARLVREIVNENVPEGYKFPAIDIDEDAKESWMEDADRLIAIMPNADARLAEASALIKQIDGGCEYAIETGTTMDAGAVRQKLASVTRILALLPSPPVDAPAAPAAERDEDGNPTVCWIAYNYEGDLVVRQTEPEKDSAHTWSRMAKAPLEGNGEPSGPAGLREPKTAHTCQGCGIATDIITPWCWTCEVEGLIKPWMNNGEVDEARKLLRKALEARSAPEPKAEGPNPRNLPATEGAGLAEAVDLEALCPDLLELARSEPHDDEECPEDDTCRCENIRKLNAEFKAIAALLRREAPAPAYQPSPGELDALEQAIGIAANGNLNAAEEEVIAAARLILKDLREAPATSQEIQP